MTTTRDTTTPSTGGGALERRTGWWGLAMVAVIGANAALSLALGAIPASWTDGARVEVGEFLADRANLDRSLVLFALSNLIFVFGIGFFAGLRRLADAYDTSGWTKGVVTIGAALFLAGGLVSETLHTGIAVALRSTPSYELDANSLLLLQSLWPTALAQGQVGLGVVVMALSVGAWRTRGLPLWLVGLGMVAGGLAIVRPAVVSQVPLFIALFVPMFVWIAALGVVLIRRSDRLTPRPGLVAETQAGAVASPV
jgi:hypothetical protein